MRNRIPAIAAGFVLAATSASAHVVLTQTSAKGGSSAVAAFRVTHGCDGAPTTALRIAIPESVVSARPQPKPGWTLSLDRNGDRVTAITWSGGTLPSDEFDEFSVLLKLPKDAGPLVFPATQTCGKGVEQWNEIPQAGQNPHALKNPAPVLTVTADPAAMDDMPGMPMDHHHMK
ncbi:MAG: YcnI family copper-binding membrane protein [Rhizomicrobium sp.]